MDQENETKSRRNKSKEKKKKDNDKGNKKKLSIFRLILIIFIMICFISAGAVAGLVLAIARSAPDVDPTDILSTLNEHSLILDEKGNVIEKIQTREFRTIVHLDEIPDYVEDAFVSIEDERFEEHMGIDPKRILGALWADIKAGAPVQGASTITQQLVKNKYLKDQVDKQNLLNDVKRKIKEAYLAIKMERVLTKEQILEGYLNTIYMGQGAYGVQAASKIYFSKDIEDLTIAQAALIAGLTKNPVRYALYKTDLPQNVNEEVVDVVGHIYKGGQKYAIWLNEKYKQTILKRQKTILNKMLELQKISKEEYDLAKSEDVWSSIKPDEKRLEGISSYFADYVKDKVEEDLMEKAGCSERQAEALLLSGGLRIYTTMDIDLQHRVEGVYKNFDTIMRKYSRIKNNDPLLVNSKNIRNGNIVSDHGRILYRSKNSLIDNTSNLIIEKGTYNFDNNGNLIINNNKISIYKSGLDIDDYYTKNQNKNILTHQVRPLLIDKASYDTKDVSGGKGTIIIKKSFLDKNNDFSKTDNNGNLLISNKYFMVEDGVIQPQSAVTILDYRTGKIRAMVGGRNFEGSRILNRATNSKRQPGSAMKPLGVYLPALNNGFTAASVIDDTPFYNPDTGKLWPKNWYSGYRGLTPLREAVEQSSNVTAVKMLEKIGIGTSIDTLKGLGLDDSLVTRDENKSRNDETLAALALGGMSQGISPLEMSAAYGAIANKGVYTEPIVYTKVLNASGEVILENSPFKNRVVTADVAYIMNDILESVVTDGLGKRAIFDRYLFDGAYNNKIPAAGKTGTTQEQTDVWFAGYTPYYSAGVWIGHDIAEIKLHEGSTSSIATMFWAEIMKEVHKGLEPKDFEMPNNLVTQWVCKDSGKLVTKYCKEDPRGSRARRELFVKGTEPTEYCTTHVKVKVDTSTNKLATEYCPEDLVEEKVFIKREPAYNPEDHNGIVPKDYQYTVPTEECDEHTEENTTDDDDDGWFKKWLFGDDDEEKDNNDTNDNDNTINIPEDNSDDKEDNSDNE